MQGPSEDAMAALQKAASNIRVELPRIGEVTLTGRVVRNLVEKLAKKY